VEKYATLLVTKITKENKGIQRWQATSKLKYCLLSNGLKRISITQCAKDCGS